MTDTQKIRRKYRFTLTEEIIFKLDRKLKKFDLSDTDFSRLMTKKYLGGYENWTTCKSKLGNLRNGKFPSDDFAANVLNVLSKLTEDLVETLLPNRCGYSDPIVGQSLDFRKKFLGADKTNAGRMLVRKHMNRTMKEEI